jgi:hypothetical protein
MYKHLVPILVTAALVPAALVGAGCGGNDNSKSDNASPPSTSAPSKTPDIPTNAADLKDACVKDAQKIGESKDKAEKNCTVPSDKSVKKAVNSALKSCLETANQLPAGSEKTQAIKDCKDSVK